MADHGVGVGAFGQAGATRGGSAGGHGQGGGPARGGDGPLPLTEAQQRAIARLAMQTAADLVQTASLWPDAAVFVSLTTGTVFDRVEGALYMLRGAPSTLRQRADELWREIEVYHQALLLSVLARVRHRARAAVALARNAGRTVSLTDLLAVACIGAQRGVRHFDPGGEDPLWPQVRNWTRKALGEEAGTSGLLRVSESALETARDVRAGRLAPTSPKAQATSAIWAGKAMKGDAVENGLADTMATDAGDLEHAIDRERLQHAVLLWLDALDPFAAAAVRERLGVGANPPRPGDFKTPPGDTNGANLGDLTPAARRALRRGAWQRGLDFLMLRAGHATKLAAMAAELERDDLPGEPGERLARRHGRRRGVCVSAPIARVLVALRRQWTAAAPPSAMGDGLSEGRNLPSSDALRARLRRCADQGFLRLLTGDERRASRRRARMVAGRRAGRRLSRFVGQGGADPDESLVM